MGSHMAENADIIDTTVLYLIKDPKFEHEKPYTVFYDNAGAFPKTNTTTESKEIQIRDYRHQLEDKSFQNVGFSLGKINCGLKSEEYQNEDSVKSSYYPAIIEMLSPLFPTASRIKVLGHSV
jgi:hypothetical protein